MADWEIKSTEPVSTDWAVASEAPADKPMSWGEVGKGALYNFGKSAVNFAKDTVHPFIHPVQTVEDLGSLGAGVLEKTGLKSGTKNIPAADAVGKYFRDRYGGVENIKHTMATDPVGFAGDASTILSAGGTALERAPGIIGKVGEVAGKASRAINPVTGPAAAVSKAGGFVAGPIIGELATHTGADSIAEAAKQGYLGGQGNKDLLRHMRGQAPASEAVDEAKKGLLGLRREMTAAYNRDMAPIKQDPTVLDFNKIDKAVSDAEGIQTYSGRSGTGPTQVLNQGTEGVRSQMKDLIENWKNLDPQDFHTIEGMDALKKSLGQIYNSTEANTPDRVVARKIYDAVKNSIAEQNPEYKKVMSKYSGDLDELNEIEKELSLGEKATTGTALRKLQSIMRNNASSAYEHRKQLGERVVEGGAENLVPKLAGQALRPPVARGLGRMVPTLFGAGEAGSLFSSGHLSAAPLALGAGAIALSSPRLMGEVANKVGTAARPFKHVPPNRIALSAFQAGQATSPIDILSKQAIANEQSER